MRNTMKITEEQRDNIMYIVGMIDGIICAGCSFDGEEIKKLLEPIRDDLSAIITYEELREWHHDHYEGRDLRMTIEKAIDQLDWYFQADDGLAAEEVTKEAYETLKRIAESKKLEENK